MFFTAPAQYLIYAFPDSWVLTAVSAGFLRFLLSANYQWIVIAAIEDQGEKRFSKIRSSGTVGFLLVQLLLFVLTTPSIGIFSSPVETAQAGSIFYAFCIIPALFVPKKRTSPQEFRFNDAVQIVKKKHMLLFFVFSFFFYFAYQVTDNYQGRYFQISHGLNSVFLSWVFAVLLETPFLLATPRIVHRFGIYSLFFFSLSAGVIRFIFFTGSTFGTSLNWMLVFQLPHAILFAAYYMGAVLWLRHTAPGHLYGSVSGLFSIFAQSLGGMAGNLVCGALLHADIGSKLTKFFQVPGGQEKSLDFFPVFLISAILYFLLIPCFIYLKKSYHIHALKS